MATVKAFLRTSTKRTKSVNVRFRLSDGERVQLFYKSKLTIDPAVLDIFRSIITPKGKRVFHVNVKSCSLDGIINLPRLFCAEVEIAGGDVHPYSFVE